MAEKLISLKKKNGSSGGSASKVDSVSCTIGVSTTVNLGFRPNQLVLWSFNTAGDRLSIVTYDVRHSAVNYIEEYGSNTGSSASRHFIPLGSTSAEYYLLNLDSSGFTFTPKYSGSTNGTVYYFAIG